MEVAHEPLNEAEVAGLLKGARLLEEDRFGPKVYELADGGRMLKLFRVKRLLSSNLWSPYARRFVQNSLRLRAAGIPSPACVRWGRIPHLDRQYVLYEKLPGRPLRDCDVLDPDQLGKFFAQLHDHGIYFRSCHLGNVLVLEGSGELGLIDVMDMRFRRRALTDGERERNFRHLRRLDVDRKRLDPIWKPFLEAYARG